MDIQFIAASLQRHRTAPRAVRVLMNYNHPLSEKEAGTLAEFNQSRSEQLEAGMKVDEVPESMRLLMERPRKALRPLLVIQCALAASRLPSLAHTHQRMIRKQLLPLVATATPLSLAEWATVLGMACQLPVTLHRSALGLAEAVVTLAAPLVLGGGGTADTRKAVPRKDTSMPNLKHCTPAEAKSILVKTLALVVRAAATFHARAKKHSEKLAPIGNEVFLLSSSIRRLQRSLHPFAVLEQEANCTAVQSLTPVDLVAVSIACRAWCAPVPKDVLFATIKAHPGVVYTIAGTTRCIAGTLPLEKAEDGIQGILYNMGLTSTTLPMFMDYVAVLQSAGPTNAVAQYFLVRGKGAFSMLFAPFVSNSKVLTCDVACRLAASYANLFSGMEPEAAAHAPLLAGFAEECAFTLSNRCRSAPEKAAVMSLMIAMLATLSDEARANLPRREELGRILNREVGIPAPESAERAVCMAVLLHAEEFVTDGLASAVKAAKKNDAIRRLLLVHLEPSRCPPNVQDELATALLEDCVEMEVVRPDAFLALYFAVRTDAALVAKRCPLLSGADVLGQLGMTENTYERQRVADVAIALARVGQYAPLAQLLTHPSGELRRPILAFINSMAADASFLVPLWDTVVASVFGLDKDAPVKIISESAEGVLLPVATALLRHTAKLTVTTMLVDVLLCCGHDSAQGEDATFFLSNNATARRYNAACQHVKARVFKRLFTDEFAPLLSQHVSCVTASLVLKIAAPAHISIAACRALTLLLTVTKATASKIAFKTLLQAVQTATAFFEGLDAQDSAIAAESLDVMDEYEDAALRGQHLLKTYPDRPPKGMSVDDFIEMKKKDAVALANGRESLQAAVVKRTKQIRAVVRHHKAVFLAVRLMGTNGCYDISGAAVLYPFLQRTLNKGPGSIPSVLADLVLGAIVGLMASTPLAYLVESMAVTVARLDSQKTLTVSDVAQISAMALNLRMAVTQMLPAPLFVVLTPFARVAFKAGRGSNAVLTTIPVATQHQLLGILLQNIGQANLPEPTEAMQLLVYILPNFPSLYKSVQQGVHTLMSMIPSAHLPVIEAALFNSTDAVREVTAAAFHRFTQFAVCREALVLAAVFLNDPSSNVVRAMEDVLSDSRFLWELQPEDWPTLLSFLKAYGAQRQNATRIVDTMKHLFDPAVEAQQLQWVSDIIQVGSLASVVALQALSPSSKSEVSATIIDYLCTITEKLDATEALMKSVLAAGRVVLLDTDLVILKRIAPTLQERLAKPPKEASAAHKEQYLATSSVWLTIISCRLQETALLEAIIEQQSRVLNNSQSAMAHRCVCDAMVEITKNVEIRKSPKLDEFVVKCLKQTISSGSYIKKKAHAWGLVGVLQGLGLPALRRYGVVEAITKAARERQTEKSGAMVLIEVLCDVMGILFEPYALSLSHVLLEGVADADPKISECADDASRAFMSGLTGIGLRQLIPRLVEMLSSEQAKRRVPPLNFIGYVAFCSPKQLAAALPQIMRHVMGCLFDVNNAVSVAAYNALRRVAGVVSNPEIQEHVELILRAMRSPSTETETALDALMYTRFINVVDPASLALIIPVLCRGLSSQMPHTRPKAAQIVASMVTLVNDPMTLLPYSDELVHLLEEASQDPQAESRTTSAKAIAALTAAIGGSLIDNVTQWCFGVLQKTQSGAIEKAGAAQVFVEVMSACGDSVLEAYYSTIESGITDERPPVREGFLYIMVYAPSTLSTESFQKMLPVAFPWVLDGLSHFSDKVRDVALAAGDSIIALYGTRNLSLVLRPLLEGVVSEVTTLRHSSLLLASKLMMHLVACIKKKMRIQAALNSVTGEEEREELGQMLEQEPNLQVGGEEETGMLTMEAARDVEKRGVSILGSLDEMLGSDNLARMLSAIYCGRHEHGANVRGDCNMAWNACVASIRAAVNKIFDGLVCLLVHFGSSSNPDCEEVAWKTIEFTSRISETIERLIDAFCDIYKEGTYRSKIGALKGLATVVQYADPKKLMSMGGQIVGCVLPGMQDKDEHVQEAARVAFAHVSRLVGSHLIEGAVEAQLTTSVRGVVEVVKVKPRVALALVFKFLNSQKELNERNLELLEAILDVEEAEEDLGSYHEDIVRLLLAFLVQKVNGAGDVMVQYVAMMPSEHEHLVVEYFQKALNVPHTRHGALLAAEAFGLGTDVDNVEGVSAALRAIIVVLGDEEDDIRADAVRMLPQLITSLEQRVIDGLEEEEQQDITTTKRASGRYLLQYLDVLQSTVSVTARAFISSGTPDFTVLSEGEPRLFDVLMSFYNRGLDYGTPMQKVEAVECIQDLMSFAPRAISTTAANTVAGRCSKALFTRNDGAVVLALVRLCLKLMNYPASGKEKMVEGTMALAMFNAALCDAGEARVLALRVVVQLLQRSEKYADLILGTVVTKRAAVDSALRRTVMCRFISVVMRYANFEKSFPHFQKLMDVVRPIWERAETPGQAAAAGIAVGALCKSVSMSEEVLGDIKERTLAITSTCGLQALAGFAMVYAFVTAAPGRTDQSFLDVASELLRDAASFGAADKLTTMWMLRAAAAIASTGCVSLEKFRVEAYVPLLRRVNPADETMMSTAQYFFDCVTGAYPTTYGMLESFPREPSSQWNAMGRFDADMDDEVEADSVL